MTTVIEQLLSSTELYFDRSLRGNLPEDPGIYAISVRRHSPGEFVRSGRADAARGLRQRVYQNHFMGSQVGNLRSQLFRAGQCSSLEEAKSWIRSNCVVQILVMKNDEERKWAEHFMLSVLHPSFSD